MTNGRLKYKAVLLTWLIFSNVSGFAYSEELNDIKVLENKTLKISPHKKIKIQIKDVVNYIISNPEIAKVEIVNDEITITGLDNTGTTNIFFRQKNNPALIPYSIISDYSEVIKEAEKRLANPIVYKNEKNRSTGIYTIDLSFNKSNLNNISNQTANHFISYNMPSSYGNLGIRGSFLNRFANLNSVENISLTNGEISFLNKDFDIKVGSVVTRDPFFIHTSQPLDALYPFNINIRGLNFSGKGEKFNYSVYTGLHKNEFVFYDIQNDYNLKTIDTAKNPDLYTLGATTQFNLPYKNLSVFATANSNFEIEGTKNKYLNLISGFNIDPLDNFNINGSIGTNLNGLGFYLNSIYTYSWAKDKINNSTDLIRLTGTLKNLGKGYFFNNNESIGDYSLTGALSHRSGFNFSGSYGVSTNNNTINSDAMSFSVSKNLFGDLINVYSSVNMSNFRSQIQENRLYQAGLDINYQFPLNINYSLLQRKSSIGDVDQSQIRATLGLIKNTFVDLNFNSYYNKNIYSNISTSIFGSYINSIFKINEKLNLNNTLGYIFDFGSDNGLFRTDTLILNSRLGWNIDRNNTINLAVGFNNRFLPQNNDYNISSTLNYTYNFGASLEEAKGTIKGFVFDDKNDNGILDKDESAVKGIKVKLKDKEIESVTTEDGYLFKDLKYGSYEVVIDNADLAKGYRLTSPSSLPVYLDSDSSEVNFSVSTQGIIKGIIYKNKYHSSSLEGIEVVLDNKEKVVTGDNGLFFFKTNSGKHTLRIDPRKIPTGYILSEKLVKEIDLDKEENVSFTFHPVINFTGTVVNKNGLPIANIELNVKSYDESGIKEEVIRTDNNGMFTLRDLSEGTIEVSSKLLKAPIEFEIPESPSNIQKTIIIK